MLTREHKESSGEGGWVVGFEESNGERCGLNRKLHNFHGCCKI